MKKIKKIDIVDSLYAASNARHKDFNVSLILSVDKDKFIGVPTPDLRIMACDMVENGTWRDFIADLPHNFFEENQLHAFILSELQDFDFVVKAVEKFLPYVDNWATCDQMSPKIFIENSKNLLPYIEKWIKSKHIYTARFAVLALMRYFLKEDFDKKYLDMVASITHKEYYINMAQAWYFAAAAVNHFNDVLPYLDRLDDWTRRRTIQKAIQSYRISDAHKLRLKKLRKKAKK